MTKIVSFPGLGLEFTLNPVAFSVFGWPIHWYGIIIAAGFLLAVGYCFRFRADPFGVDKEKLFDMLYFAVPLALVGARAYYVIFELPIYLNPDGSFNWRDAVALWDGGLAIYGGVIGAVLTVFVYCRVRKQSFWDYADVGCYGLLIGQLVGRWGNFVNVEAYGSLTTLPWRMCSETIANELWRKGLLESQAVYESIVNGTVGVHPTFIYESLWNLLGFVLLVLLARRGRKFSGQMFLSYIAWYGFGRALIEGLRTDSLYLFGTTIRTSQALGIVSAATAVVLMLVLKRTAGPATPPRRCVGGSSAEEHAEKTTEEEAHQEGEQYGGDQD